MACRRPTCARAVDPFRPCGGGGVGYNNFLRIVSAFVARGKDVRLGYFDCFSGIAGDMTMAALVDAGVDPPGDPGGRRRAWACLASSRSRRCVAAGSGRPMPRSMPPHEHAHRHLHHIEAIIDKSSLTPRQKDLAQADLPASWARPRPGARDRISPRSISMRSARSTRSWTSSGRRSASTCSGSIVSRQAPCRRAGAGSRPPTGGCPCPRRRRPNSSEACPLAESMVEGELTTPTGAAILTTVVERFGPFPAHDDRVDRPGGRHQRDARPGEHRPAVRRRRSICPPSSDRVWVLETNLDDLPGEVVGYTMTRLMEAGALDAFVTPIQMKKNRPGVMVSVLCDEPKIAGLEEISLPRDDDAGHPPISGEPAQAEAAGHRGRYAVRAGQGKARLARRSAADVQPRVR